MLTSSHSLPLSSSPQDSKQCDLEIRITVKIDFRSTFIESEREQTRQQRSTVRVTSTIN